MGLLLLHCWCWVDVLLWRELLAPLAGAGVCCQGGCSGTLQRRGGSGLLLLPPLLLLLLLLHPLLLLVLLLRHMLLLQAATIVVRANVAPPLLQLA